MRFSALPGLWNAAPAILPSRQLSIDLFACSSSLFVAFGTQYSIRQRVLQIKPQPFYGVSLWRAKFSRPEYRHRRVRVPLGATRWLHRLGRFQRWRPVLQLGPTEQ